MTRLLQDLRPARVRSYLFVTGCEPLAAAQAAWSARAPIDLCVSGPSAAARDAAAFACAGRRVKIVEEPLLAARRPGEDDTALISRHAEALRALYALETWSALVVWDEIAASGQTPLVFDDAWLLHTAELIDRHLRVA
ncbi:MAG: hypothetical protein ACJ76I_06805 [Gaiellaceae bacterium]